jgi:DNA-directed RNA polymerase specialized sigma24 family protein
MRLRQLFEAPESVGFIFGRFNPPHKGHRAAWEMLAKNTHWYVGTNKSTQGPKDPLPYDVKIKAMETIWPEVAGHIVPHQSWLTLANEIYEKHGDVVLNVYTDEDWVLKALNQYNGVEGKSHGYYNFPKINSVPTPRLSSATALRTAVANNDRDAFADAAGVPADTPVDGKPFFDLVAEYLEQYKKEDTNVDEKERVVKKSMSGDTKSFRGTANRLPTDNAAGARDITKKAVQTDMPGGSYELDFDNLDKEKLKQTVARMIDEIPNDKNKQVIQAYFGLGKFEKSYTLEQIAKAMGVTKGVIGQRVHKVLRQLRHPSKSRELRPFLDDKRR